MNEEALLEELPADNSDMRISTRVTREIYIGIPDRFRKDKRQGDPDDMDEDINKTHKINSEV